MFTDVDRCRVVVVTGFGFVGHNFAVFVGLVLRSGVPIAKWSLLDFGILILPGFHGLAVRLVFHLVHILFFRHLLDDHSLAIRLHSVF